MHSLHLVLMMIWKHAFKTDTIWSVSDENLKVKLSKNQATKKRCFSLSDVNKVNARLN